MSKLTLPRKHSRNRFWVLFFWGLFFESLCLAHDSPSYVPSYPRGRPNRGQSSSSPVDAPSAGVPKKKSATSSTPSSFGSSRSASAKTAVNPREYRERAREAGENEAERLSNLLGESRKKYRDYYQTLVDEGLSSPKANEARQRAEKEKNEHWKRSAAVSPKPGASKPGRKEKVASSGKARLEPQVSPEFYEGGGGAEGIDASQFPKVIEFPKGSASPAAPPSQKSSTQSGSPRRGKRVLPVQKIGR